MFLRKGFAKILLAASMVGVTQVGVASDSDVFGMGAFSLLTSSAADQTDGRIFAAKGNPAGLSLNDKIGLSLSYRITEFNLKDTSATSVGDPNSSLTPDPVDVTKAYSEQGLHVGAVLPLGKLLTVGLAAHTPANTIARVHTLTRNEVNYLHFNDKAQRPEIYSAASFKLPYGLSLGAGLLYSVKARGVVQLGVNRKNAETRMFMEVNPIIIPYGGILWNTKVPGGQLLVGASYRGEDKGVSKVGADVNMGVGLGPIKISTNSSVVAFYDPAQVGLGLGLKSKSFATYLSVEKSYWSKYKAPIIELSGSDIDSYVSQGTINVGEVKLKDTYSFRLGGELINAWARKSLSMNILGGVEYHTSALEDNPKNVFILDTDRFGASLGLDLKMAKLKPLIDYPVSFYLGGKWLSLKAKEFSASDSTARITKAKAHGSIFTGLAGVKIEI